MPEIDLMRNYPVTDRTDLLNIREEVTREDRIIAKKFGKDYFDGPRRLGLGGYYYHPKYFTNVVQDFINYYNLKPNAKILDVGCGKGFMMKDFKDALPNAEICGIDISEYCFENAMLEVKDKIKSVLVIITIKSLWMGITILRVLDNHFGYNWLMTCIFQKNKISGLTFF